MPGHLTSARAGLPFRVLAGVFCLALLVRLAVLAVLGPRLGVDSLRYIERAYEIVAGGPLVILGLPVENSPLYSVFLVPGVLAGIDVAWYAALSQAALGAATVVVLAQATFLGTGGVAAGLLAGAIASVHPTFVFWGVYVLSDTLFLFVLALILERLLRLYSSVRPLGDAAIVGLLLAISVGIRPTAFPFALSVLALVALSALRDWQRLARLVAGLVLPWVVVLTAWIAGAALEARAVAVGGRRTGSRLGKLGGVPGVGVDGGRPRNAGHRRRSRSVAGVGDNERSAAIDVHANGPGSAVPIHCAQPDFFVQQAVRKARTLWAPVLPEASRAHAILNLAWFIPLYCLSVVGLAIAFRRYRELAMVTSVGIATFTLTSLLTFVDYDQRYRLPIELFLIPLAATGLVWLMEKRAAPARILERVAVAGQ